MAAVYGFGSDRDCDSDCGCGCGYVSRRSIVLDASGMVRSSLSGDHGSVIEATVSASLNGHGPHCLCCYYAGLYVGTASFRRIDATIRNMYLPRAPRP